MKFNRIKILVLLMILIIGGTGCGDDSPTKPSSDNSSLDSELVGTWACFSALRDGEPDIYDDMYGYLGATCVFNSNGTYTQTFNRENEYGPIVVIKTGTWSTNDDHDQMTCEEDDSGETGIVAYNIASNVLTIVSTYGSSEFETKWNKQ